MTEPQAERHNFDPHLMELVASGYFDQFTQPITSRVDEQTSINQFAETITDRFENLFVIGRIQPLHRGHIHLINHALAIASSITIGIGSANVINRDNPFSAEHREHMLKRALQAEGLESRVRKIVRINGYEDDTMWFNEMLRRIGEIDGVVGNNDWVNNLFREAGYRTLEIPLFKRSRLSGTTIREDFLYAKGVVQIPQ